MSTRWKCIEPDESPCVEWCGGDECTIDAPAEPVGGTTPRTDAAAFKQNDGTTRYSTNTGAPLKVVSVDFARQLERELAHANKELDEWDYSYWTKQVEEWREKVKNAEREVVELRKDAERLDWLAKAEYVEVKTPTKLLKCHGFHLVHVIDSALKEPKND